MISKKTINAVEVCLLLAGQRGEYYLTITDLSPILKLSISYLENIFKILKINGLVQSMKGPGGGYKINGDITLISIWDVVSAFEKTLPSSDQKLEIISLDFFERELELVVVETLKGFTLADFADFSTLDTKSHTNGIGNFKLKPLPVPLVPKAPNSVFQLAMSF
jgi:Rrf2 family protein